ncbi:Nn.00g089310.m01.CDS01 [Neocucurbitaria sp. VM-36]
MSTTTSEQQQSNQPVYFWRPNQGNGYLGQWFWSAFTVNGETYATAEMWMMVQKARLFGDEVVAAKMLATTNPKEHKALGRKVKNFDGGKWDEHKLQIVIDGNYHKFTVSDDAKNLRSMLLATGERELVEASPMDRIWGVGFTEKDAGKNRVRWGENLLGEALMSVRGRLREEGGKDQK